MSVQRVSTDWVTRIRFQVAAGCFPFTVTTRLALRPTLLPIRCVPGARFQGEKPPQREAHHHFHLVPSLRMRGAIHPHPHTSSWHGILLTFIITIFIVELDVQNFWRDDITSYTKPMHRWINYRLEWNLVVWKWLMSPFLQYVSRVLNNIQHSKHYLRLRGWDGGVDVFTSFPDDGGSDSLRNVRNSLHTDRAERSRSLQDVFSSKDGGIFLAHCDHNAKLKLH
jgi:hypothetical protein